MSIQVVESEKIETSEPLAITGFPDIGLVGTIAAAHIVRSLGLREIGHLSSPRFPPVTVVHEGRPKPPIRLYGSRELLVAVSEIPVPPYLIFELSATLVSWLKERGVSLLTILGGIMNPRRLEIKELSVYGVSTGEKEDRMLREKGIKLFEEGFLAGQDGVLLRSSLEQGLPSIYLMADSHYSFPDPGAAAAVINAVNSLFDLDVNVKALLEKEDEIRLVTRELMQRTQENMQAMQKEREHELPVMYR